MTENSVFSWFIFVLRRILALFLLVIIVVHSLCLCWINRFFFRPLTSSSLEFSDIMSFSRHLNLQCEEHYAVTKDGFILKLFHIFQDSFNRGYPVLCTHSLTTTSFQFFCSGEKSLVYLLAKNHFDVWLGNNRGNVHSRRHVSLSPTQVEFWKWGIDVCSSSLPAISLSRFLHFLFSRLTSACIVSSFVFFTLRQEMALDCRAMIESVLLQTGSSSLAYIGHSQGISQLVVAVNSFPSLISSISLVIALSPAVFLRPFSNVWLKMLSYLLQYQTSLFFALFGHSVFLPEMELGRPFVSHRIWTCLGEALCLQLVNWRTDNWDPTDSSCFFRVMTDFCCVSVSLRFLLILLWLSMVSCLLSSLFRFPSLSPLLSGPLVLLFFARAFLFLLALFCLSAGSSFVHICSQYSAMATDHYSFFLRSFSFCRSLLFFF